MLKNFSWEYVKKNPVMFGAIFLVFGLLLWLVINRGASGGSGSTTVVATGPSEALQAANLQAGTQIQLAQISANSANNQAAFQLEALSRQIEAQGAIAALEMQYRVTELAASERMTELQTTASLAALTAQLNTQRAMSADNNAFALDYARQANDAAVQTVAINAMLQREMGAQQLEAFKAGLDNNFKQSVLATIPSLRRSDRDDALAGFVGYQPVRGGARGGGLLSGIGQVVGVLPDLVKAVK